MTPKKPDRFTYRGPNTFYFKRKRHKLYSLRVQMAFLRVCRIGGGGGWSAQTGDGEAWHKVVDQRGPWYRVRAIKGGQWAGPWRYMREHQR